MKRYWPLIVVVMISIIGGVAILPLGSEHTFKYLMVNVSGFFFLFLATLKFWDLNGFYRSFSKYDIVAKKSVFYGYLYPFLELIIAVGYLSHFFIIGVAFLTFVLMLVSILGVFAATFTHKDLRCACMGSRLDVPLTVVSLVEILAMGSMAVLIIVKSF